MSHRTTEHCIGAIIKNVANNLICDLQNCIAFGLALGKSTNIHNIPQWAIFIGNPDVNVKEEMLDLVAFIETTCSINVRNALDEIMLRFELPHNKVINVVTDRASVMMKKKLRSHWSFKQWS